VCGVRYMMESIAAMPKEVQDLIEFKEWSIKTKDGIAKFMELKGKVLPTICIERDLVFPSIIPLYEELIDQMVKRAPTAEVAEKIKAAREWVFSSTRFRKISIERVQASIQGKRRES